MVEHAENFLSLYGVEMDAALEIQSPESWDSFPLFQLLNDFLRNDCKHFLEHLVNSSDSIVISQKWLKCVIILIKWL